MRAIYLLLPQNYSRGSACRTKEKLRIKPVLQPSWSWTEAELGNNIKVNNDQSHEAKTVAQLQQVYFLKGTAL